MEKIKTGYFKRYSLFFLSFFLIILPIILYILKIFTIAPKLILLLCILLTAVYLRKLPHLLKDWFVFLSFLYLFDSLRGLIYILLCRFNFPVYTTYVIKLERLLFGGIPPIMLQQALLKGPNLSDFTWLEKSLTIIYGTHYVAFLYIGIIIWIQKPDSFLVFKNSFYLLTFLGILGYFLVPTVPPWMASSLFNILPEITHFNRMIFNVSIPNISRGFDLNPIAAMPSLHAAYPFLTSIILWHFYRWKAIGFYIYTSLVLFAVVYTGDHYIVDVIAGAILALLCFRIALFIKKKEIKINLKKISSLKRKIPDYFFAHGHIILGLFILSFGISLGLSNKHQFSNHAIKYMPHAPYYVDFFNNKPLYQNNLHVQIYLGNHFVLKRQHKNALYHFEQAKKLNDGTFSQNQIETAIERCKLLINRLK